MAKLSFEGIDDLMLSLEEVAQIPDDVAAAMLDAEAKVVEEAVIAAGMHMGVYRTGQTLRSVRRGKMKKGRDGARQMYITPQGTNDRGERNAAVGFINEFGKRGQPARPFMRTAVETAAGPAVAEAEIIYDEFLKSKNL